MTRVSWRLSASGLPRAAPRLPCVAVAETSPVREDASAEHNEHLRYGLSNTRLRASDSTPQSVRYALSRRLQPHHPSVCLHRTRPHTAPLRRRTTDANGCKQALQRDERRQWRRSPVVTQADPRQAKCGRLFPIPPHALLMVATAVPRQRSRHLRGCGGVRVGFPP